MNATKIEVKSPLAAWRSCEDGSWLLWVAARLNVDRRLVVQAACQCARLALPHVPEGEDRPLKAIEAAERWVDGLATVEEVRQAADAYANAADAYANAEAAFAADAATAHAAARAARAARAAYATADAAAAADAYDVDAYAAYSADAADRAADAAGADDYVTVLRQCADIVRSVIREGVMTTAWKTKRS